MRMPHPQATKLLLRMGVKRLAVIQMVLVHLWLTRQGEEEGNRREEGEKGVWKTRTQRLSNNIHNYWV